ncbi:MAG: signal peptidase II [Mycoplasmatota bacterium]
MKKIIPITFILIIIDQIIKLIVTSNLKIYESITIIKNFFYITYVENKGAAFGILEGNMILFVLIGIFAIGLIYYYFIKNQKLNNIKIIIFSMLYAGIIGNIIDRLFLGFVVDYLDFIIFNYDFAIFNFADSLIVVSLFLLLIQKEGKENANNNFGK